MAASTVDHIHTHLRNAVLLVWGSLRLAPINNFPFLHKCGALSGSPQLCTPQKKIRPHARTGARLSRVERFMSLFTRQSGRQCFTKPRQQQFSRAHVQLKSLYRDVTHVIHIPGAFASSHRPHPKYRERGLVSLANFPVCAESACYM